MSHGQMTATPATEAARPGPAAAATGERSEARTGALNGRVTTAPRDVSGRLHTQITRLRNYVSGDREGHRALVDLRSGRRAGSAIGSLADRAVGRISEGLSGAGRIPPLSIWDRVTGHLADAEAALAEYEANGDREALRRVQAATDAAGRAHRECSNQLSLYRERTEDGASQATETLQGVVATCALVGTIVGGALAAPAGAAALTVGGIATSAAGSAAGAAASTLVYGGAERASRVAHGDGEFDLAGLLADAGTAAVTTFVGALLGGGLSRVFLTIFRSAVGPAAARLGAPRVMEVLQSRGGEFLADFFSGAAATPLNVALTRVIGRMRGQRPSPERFVDAVVRELIQGGIVQLIMGAVTHGAAARAARANAPDAPTPGGAAPNGHGPDTHAPMAEARAAGGSSPPGGGGPHAPATTDATPDLGPIIGYTPSNAPVYRNGPRPEGRWLGLDRLWHMSDGSTARPGLGTVPTSGEIGRLPAADMVRDREGRFWSANNEVFPAGSGANRARGAFVVDAPAGPRVNPTANATDGTEIRAVSGANADQSSHSVVVNDDITAHRVNTGDRVTTPEMPRGSEREHMAVTTGLCGCSGIGTRARSATGDRVTLSHVYNDDGGHGQYTALVADVDRALASGASDVQSVVRLAQHHRGPQEYGARPFPSHDELMPQLRSDLEQRLIANGGPHRSVEVQGDVLIVRDANRRESARVAVNVREAPINERGSPVDQQMVVTRDGVLIRNGHDGDGESQVHTWQ